MKLKSLKKPKNILIIGNGMDIALGYKTRYSDFIATVKKILLSNTPTTFNIENEDENENENENENDYNFSIHVEQSSTNFFLDYFMKINDENIEWCNFEEHISFILLSFDYLFDLISEGNIKKHPISNVFYLDAHSHSKNTKFHEVVRFFDFFDIKVPNERIIIPNNTNTNTNNNSGYFSSFESAKNMIESYRKRMFIKIHDNYIKFVDLLSNYFKIYCKTKKHIKLKFDFNVSLVFNYNYTVRLENFFESERNCKFLSIHGLLEHNNIVLGIDQHITFTHHEFDKYKKYQLRIYNDTDYRESYDILNEKIGDDDVDFHIYGHSLDTSDRDSLSKILQNVSHENCQSKIYIYYHNPESKRNLINNLSRILNPSIVDFMCEKNRLNFIDTTENKRIVIVKE